MESFLEQVAKKILEGNRPLSEVRIILPSQRAIRFLKKALGEQLVQPVRSPKIQSITEFAAELSGLRSAPPLSLLLLCYESYRAVVPKETQESFEAFLHWAPVVLQDFNDICAHKVPQEEVFSYLTEVETLKEWARRENQTPLTRNYIQFWKQIPALFTHLVDRLLTEKLGFMGLLFSESVENLALYLEHTKHYHYIVGFNALTQSEALLFQELLSQGRAEVLWDLDRSFYENSHHAAGMFIRRYFKTWKTLAGQKPQWLGQVFEEKKSIYSVASTASVNQMKYAVQLAQRWVQQYPDERIALVLGDESYLIPALSGLDPNFTQWNVTMGYPLGQTPAADLLLQWVGIHEANMANRLRLEVVEKFLQTAALGAYLKAAGIDYENALSLAKKQNQVFISCDTLLQWQAAPPWQNLFEPTQLPFSLIERMLALCVAIQEYFFKQSKNLLFESYFYSLEKLLRQLNDETRYQALVSTFSLLRTLLMDSMQKETLSFVGEATQGLQIMGLLETRLLDFDRVIVTHVNEGQLPAGKSNASFLPYEVKKEYGIPTFQEKDAIFTYHFYRLLQRAQEVHLFYDTSDEGLGGAAPSRFLYQLELFAAPKHQFVKQTLQSRFISQQTEEAVITKSTKLLEKLHELADYGFSPSALTHYLRDPIAFYEERILGLRPADEAEAMVSYRDQGTVLHAVLESLYTPYVGKILTVSHCDAMQEKLGEELTHHFENVYGKHKTLSGKNYLIFKVLQTYCARYLAEEKKNVEKGDQIEILALEASFEIPIVIESRKTPVNLRGTVDRIDRYNGVLRILDYKTGTVSSRSLKLSATELDFEDSKTGIAFQVLTYAYQYLVQHPETQLSAGIIALKSKQSWLPLTRDDDGVLTLDTIQPFETFLKKLIQEILSPSIPIQRKNPGN